MSARAAAWLAWLVWAFAVALVVGTRVLDWITPTLVITDEPPPVDVVFSALVLTYSTVGAFVVSRRPANAIGWIFWAFGLYGALAFFFRAYAEYALHVPVDPLTGSRYLAWLLTQLGLPVMALTVVLILLLFPSGRLPSGLLFPEGRLPTRSWRAVVWMAGGAFALSVLIALLDPASSDDTFLAENPLAITGPARYVLEAATPIVILLFFVGFVFAGASLISRRVLARCEERQQLKWFNFAVAVFVAGFVGASMLGSSELAWYVGILAAWLGLTFLPVATAIAILKYHLYDIDRIINRTLVYGLLTGILAIVYLGGVTATQAVLQVFTGQEEPPQLLIVASTLAIAAMFSPLRRRLQSFIDRRFYRRKYDTRKTLEAFGSRLRDETDLGRLGDDLVGVVRETMQPAHASLWLLPDTASKVDGSSGRPSRPTS